jgi:hypothetical protein
VESKLGPLGTSATYWPIVPAPGDCEDGEICGMNGRGNQSTRRKPDLTPLCPPQIPLDQSRRGGKPATNRFSYDAANVIPISLSDWNTLEIHDKLVSKQEAHI